MTKRRIGMGNGAVSTIGAVTLMAILVGVGGMAFADNLPAFDKNVWAQSEWISAKDAPVKENPEKCKHVGAEARAADGTSWFSKSVVNERKVAKAVWMTSALGTYELYVNGKPVGTDFLKPGFTHVRKTRRAFTYDVTGLIDAAAKAENFFTAEVSAGWWRDRIVSFTGRKSAFRGALVLTFDDGSKSVIGTDAKTWKAGTAGPVTHAAIFDGEEYDARIAPPLRGEGLGEAERNDEFPGEVLPSDGAEVCLRRDLAMVRGPYSLKAGEKLVVDFAQNCAGVPFFRFKAAPGTVLTFLPAEMLNDADAPARGCDGKKGTIYRANLRNPKHAFRCVYTFGSAGGFVEYHPRFTFFGYRYAEISATGDVEIESVASVPVTSIKKEMEIGSLETGDKDVNRLIANVYWGQLSNYLSVPTDCPQRNERLGWTADTQVFADAGAFNADTRRFFHKWMRDMRDTRNEYGSFPGVAPWAQYGASANSHMRTGWADAGIIVPWKIWRQFGDVEIVEENWAAMEKFAMHTHATKRTHDAVTEECGDFQWNDWLSLDRFESAASGRNPEYDAYYFKDGKRIRREGVTDYWSFLGACYWAIDMQMMREMAAATGRDAAAWARREDEAKEYLKKNYFNTPDGTVRAPFDDMQTPAVLALKLGLVEGEAKTRTVSFLRADLAKRGNVTGFLGCSWLMDVLSANGMERMSVDLLLNHRFPSWLYSVDQGATTIWERWNGWTRDKGFGPVGMNSYNHYAYGQVLGWMYRRLAGIEPVSSAPGFKRIAMRPIFDRRLGYVKASYNSAAGTIKSEWRFEGGKVVWNFTVPEGAVADVTLPGSTETKTYRSGSWKIETAEPLAASLGGVPGGCDPSVMSAKYWQIWNAEEQAKIDADIEANRKGDFEVALDDGSVPDGAEVTVEQLSHDFRFGAHIFNFNQLGKTEYNDAYKASYGEGGIFNQATVAFYWANYEPTPGHLRANGMYEDTERYWNSLTPEAAMLDANWRRPAPGPVVDFLKSKDVAIHGHILVWGSAKPYWIYDWYCPENEKRAFDALGIPRHSTFLKRAHAGAEGNYGFAKEWKKAWRRAYERVSEEEIEKMAPVFTANMRRIFRKRIFDVAGAFGDVLDSWDVVNESSQDWIKYRKSRTGHKVWKSNYGLMPGDYPLWALLDAKEAISPAANLAINDYNISDDFLAQVKDLDGEGVKIDIVGCQMHIFNTNDCMRLAKGETGINWVGTPKIIQDRLDMMAKTGRPLHVSEITITSPGADDACRQIQAILTRNIYRKWFSHKAMMGITWWNTVDGGGVYGEPLVSGLFTRDMKKKPAYHALDELINREWKTKTVAKVQGSGAQAKVAFRGFRGKYRLTWRDSAGKERTKECYLK